MSKKLEIRGQFFFGCHCYSKLFQEKMGVLANNYITTAVRVCDSRFFCVCGGKGLLHSFVSRVGLGLIKSKINTY